MQCETLIGQIDLLSRGHPLTINLQDYAWIRDTEPGFGPLRPRGVCWGEAVFKTESVLCMLMAAWV